MAAGLVQRVQHQHPGGAAGMLAEPPGTGQPADAGPDDHQVLDAVVALGGTGSGRAGAQAVRGGREIVGLALDAGQRRQRGAERQRNAFEEVAARDRAGSSAGVVVDGVVGHRAAGWAARW